MSAAYSKWYRRSRSCIHITWKVIRPTILVVVRMAEWGASLALCSLCFKAVDRVRGPDQIMNGKEEISIIGLLDIQLRM